VPGKKATPCRARKENHVRPKVAGKFTTSQKERVLCAGRGKGRRAPASGETLNLSKKKILDVQEKKEDEKKTKKKEGK